MSFCFPNSVAFLHSALHFCFQLNTMCSHFHSLKRSGSLQATCFTAHCFIWRKNTWYFTFRSQLPKVWIAWEFTLDYRINETNLWFIWYCSWHHFPIPSHLQERTSSSTSKPKPACTLQVGCYTSLFTPSRRLDRGCEAGCFSILAVAHGAPAESNLLCLSSGGTCGAAARGLFKHFHMCWHCESDEGWCQRWAHPTTWPSHPEDLQNPVLFTKTTAMWATSQDPLLRRQVRRKHACRNNNNFIPFLTFGTLEL